MAKNNQTRHQSINASTITKPQHRPDSIEPPDLQTMDAASDTALSNPCGF
jgi:hypothetical protein